MEVAKKSITALKKFLYGTLGLKSSFQEIGIDSSNFAVMAKKACGGEILPSFKPLNQTDIETIYNMCLTPAKY